jgi:hypothetical protein
MGSAAAQGKTLIGRRNWKADPIRLELTGVSEETAES